MCSKILPPNRRLVLQIDYVVTPAGPESGGIEKKVIDELTRLDFAIIAKSRFGLSVLATKSVVEKVFRTKIESKEARVNGGFAGPNTVELLSFQTPPVIPETLARYVKSVRFTPPVVPL